MFFTIYENLCRKKGMSPNAVAKLLSISSGSVTEWKKGRSPQNSTLKKIAEFFGVSTDYLLGKAEKEKAPAETGEGSKKEIFTVYAMNGDTPGAQHVEVDMNTFAELNQLVDIARGLPKDKLEILIATAKAMQPE